MGTGILGDHGQAALIVLEAHKIEQDLAKTQSMQDRQFVQMQGIQLKFCPATVLVMEIF